MLISQAESKRMVLKNVELNWITPFNIITVNITIVITLYEARAEAEEKVEDLNSRLYEAEEKVEDLNSRL